MKLTGKGLSHELAVALYEGAIGGGRLIRPETFGVRIGSAVLRARLSGEGVTIAKEGRRGETSKIDLEFEVVSWEEQT